MSVPNVFAAVTTATGAQLDANFAAVLNLAGGGTVAGTGAGAGLVVLSDTGNASGVSLKLVGNGATTPSKTVQAKGGILTVLNDAQSATILSLSDSGVLTPGAPGVVSGDAVTLGQVKNASPLGASASSASATTETATTTTFTAPSAGQLFIIGSAIALVSLTGFTISSSLAGNVVLGLIAQAGVGSGQSHLAMTAGQTTTVSCNATMGTAAAISVCVSCFFIPTP